MQYKLPRRNYAHDALEPHIDARTMEIHHTRHHAGYVRRLNDALKKAGDLSKLSLHELLSDIRIVPEEIRQAVRNNGGGHHNHSLFWQVIKPGGQEEPQGDLADAISRSFDSLEGFRKQFSQAAESRFGSGWAWLGVNSSGQLEILSTPNQDSPLMHAIEPILGLDVWEHAYYLKYQNRRDAYIQAFWNVVNWSNVAELYDHALESLKRGSISIPSSGSDASEAGNSG
jgi:Fe-Mn family superoxide dismutase